MFAQNPPNLPKQVQLRIQRKSGSSSITKLAPFTHVNLWSSFPYCDGIAVCDVSNTGVSFRNAARIPTLLRMKRVRNLLKNGENLEAIKMAQRVIKSVADADLFFTERFHTTLEGTKTVFLLVFVHNDVQQREFPVSNQKIISNSYRL